MYTPSHFDQSDLAIQHALMRAHPLATLVTTGPAGPDANHIPLQLVAGPTPHGTLRGHVARANPIWRETPPEALALAIFMGPQAYVSPSWYPSKAVNGKAVPTWNYAVVHAHGPLRFIEDAEWLRAQIEALTVQNEAGSMHPWRVMDAPAEYIETLLQGIVGVELSITRLTAKLKASQNQPLDNRIGVAQGLRREGAAAMADLVETAADHR